MSGVTVPVTGTPGAGTRPRRGRQGRPRLPGVGGSLLSLGRALALAGLLLTGAVLLSVMLAPLVAGAIGLGQFLKYELGHGLDFNSQWTRDLLGLVLAVVGCRFVLPVALLATRRLTMLTRRLSDRWCGVPIGAAYAPRPAAKRRDRAPGAPGAGRLGYTQRMSWLLSDVGTWRDLLWLVANLVVGWVVLLVPVTLFCVGLVAFIFPAIGAAGVFSVVNLPHVARPAFPGNTAPVLLLIGLGMVAAGTWTGPLLLRGYGGLARLVLAPSREAELARRVEQLARTRTETLDTGAAELRRIERDLHDGAQARLVAMGLTLDAAGRLIDSDPAAARALLYEARDTSARALAELRDLVRGIHPPVLADRGLADAVRALALDSPLRARVTGSLPGRPPAPVESAAYFAVSELLTNVAKHAGASAAEVDLRHSGGALRITVADDGAGGADPARGTGLSGIARRLAAFDGVLVVSSPVGGPTVVSLDVPCALS